MLVGPGAEHTRKFDKCEGPENPKWSWDGKALKILDIYSESCHSVNLGTPIFEQRSLRQKKEWDIIHFAGCEQSCTMIRELMEFAVHLRMLFSIFKYMDSGLDQSTNVAAPSSSSNMKVE